MRPSSPAGSGPAGTVVDLASERRIRRRGRGSVVPTPDNLIRHIDHGTIDTRWVTDRIESATRSELAEFAVAYRVPVVPAGHRLEAVVSGDVIVEAAVFVEQTIGGRWAVRCGDFLLDPAARQWIDVRRLKLAPEAFAARFAVDLAGAAEAARRAVRARLEVLEAEHKV